MFKNLCGLSLIIIFLISVTSCGTNKKKESSGADSTKISDSVMQKKLDQFAVVRLTTDLTRLTEKEKQMIPLFFEAAQVMDDLFWEQQMGSKDEFLNGIKDDLTRRFALINYGPWERLNNNQAFIPSVGEKPRGANFYPKDMTREEFEKFANPDKTSQYTLIRRNDDKSLKVVWFHEAYKDKLQKAADLLKKAAALAEDPGLKKYLDLRAQALLTDDYFASDIAWMDMKNNTLDLVIGPIENYEDEIFGYKTSYEGAVLVKDKEWSKKLEHFSALLPKLQKELPVDPKFKKEVPGSKSDLNAYDIIYYAGDANSGGKTIAINLPNDEKVQAQKGSRRLQLKNTMKAKFDNILVPIAGKMIDMDQMKNIKFDAFFSNVMFHEVGHGLGIKNTINGRGEVRKAMKEQYSAFEEAKADILGLFLATKLIEMGEIKDLTAEDCFVTYMAGLIRSVRFGAGDAHGKANMMCFNYFEDQGAFTRKADGTYKVDFEKTRKAMNAWAEKVLVIEGTGDYDGAVKYAAQNSIIRPQLQADLDQLKKQNIPVDIVFDQGLEVVGLK